MKNYLEIIEKALKDRLGVENTDDLEFRELPDGEKESYNTDKVIGNKNLFAGRINSKSKI